MLYTSRTDGSTVYRWYEAGRLHRTCGPAVEYVNAEDIKIFQAWYFKGLHHRAGGPAIAGIWVVNEWWYCGVRETEPENYVREIAHRRAMLRPLHVLLPIMSCIAYPLADLVLAYQ
jgi:hypothetical protein